MDTTTVMIMSVGVLVATLALGYLAIHLVATALQNRSRFHVWLGSRLVYENARGELSPAKSHWGDRVFMAYFFLGLIIYKSPYVERVNDA